jgi:hypothetical protein
VENALLARRILLVNGDEHTHHAYLVPLELDGLSVREAGSVAATPTLARHETPWT